MFSALLLLFRKRLNLYDHIINGGGGIIFFFNSDLIIPLFFCFDVDPDFSVYIACGCSKPQFIIRMFTLLSCIIFLLIGAHGHWR